MKILAEISDKTVGLGPKESLGTQYELRKSARVILLNEAGEIALQHLQNYNFYKLPGGGVDTGETIEQAAKREVQEEVGCDCEIIRPIGVVIEYREKYKLIHISYCFEAKVVGPITAPAFEENEIKAGQANIWINPEKLLELVKNGERTNYESYFNISREVSFLEEYFRVG